MNQPLPPAGALFAAPTVKVDHREDGTIIVHNPTPLEPYARCVGEYLEHWAQTAPDRPFLLERSPAGLWVGVTYQQALDKVYRIGSWLLRQSLKPGQPVCVLSDNQVNHALLMLAAMHVGIPYSGISPAYSLLSQDHAKLKNLVQRIDPGVIYVGGAGKFKPALQAINGLHQAKLVVADDDELPGPDALHFSDMLSDVDLAGVRQAFAAITPETVAKILFTSGSTGYPKGVVNPQRMLCASQQAKRQLWPFLTEQPPVLIDWLPWNHTFGGNHNFNLILANGGTFYLDGGKPVPGLFDTTIANLREVAPTLYLNVPKAFDMLVPALREDAALRRNFFSKLQVIFYAAAALPQHLWDGLIELSNQELGYAVPMVTAWGSTETSPLATDCHFQADRSGVIGVPVPGVSLKLVPNADKLEVRVKGPNVTPGYFNQPEDTAKAFDEEGFYLIGDAVCFADADRPEAGLVFNGRVSEDFKLMSGTWVSVGNLRVKGIEYLAPVAQDIVVTGHNLNSVGFLIFPNVAACRRLAGLGDDAPAADVLASQAVRDHVAQGLKKLHGSSKGSSTFADRAVLMSEPPSVDAGEITDKGYINQSASLRSRAALVDALYADAPGPDVILI